MRRCALVVSAWGNPKSTFTPFRLYSQMRPGGKSFSRIIPLSVHFF